MRVILDTCALVWLTLDPTLLSAKAHKLIARSESLLVSSISIWEIGVKAKKGKIELGTDYQDYVDRVAMTDTIQIVPVDHRIWVESVTLDWKHRDPADRVIVSLAKMLGLPFITDDQTIARFYDDVVF